MGRTSRLNWETNLLPIDYVFLSSFFQVVLEEVLHDSFEGRDSFLWTLER